MFALVAACLGYLARSWWAGALALVVAFAFVAGNAWYGETWFPMLYAPAFLLFTAAAAVVGSGRTRFLPLAVLASGLLVHGHVSFLLYVGGPASPCWSVGSSPTAARSGRSCGATGSRFGRPSSSSRLFLVPLVAQTVRNFPSPWREYIAFSRDAQNDPRTVSEVVAYVAKYWTETPWPVWVYAVAGFVLVLLLAVDRRRRRRLGYAGGRDAGAPVGPRRLLRLPGHRPSGAARGRRLRAHVLPDGPAPAGPRGVDLPGLGLCDGRPSRGGDRSGWSLAW